MTRPMLSRILVAPGSAGHTWLVAPGGVARLGRVIATTDDLTDDEVTQLEQATLLRTRSRGTYHLTVLTSTACNLACPYCFQNTSRPDDGGGERIPPAHIDSNVVATLTRFVASALRTAEATELSLVLFGGEPLMSPTGCLTVLEALTEVAPLRARMITNGMLLTPSRAKQLEAAGLRSVQITFDGDAEQHNSLRFTRNGRGTFSRILKNVCALQEETDILTALRMNLAGDDMSSYHRLIDVLAESVDQSRCVLDLALVRDYPWNDATARYAPGSPLTRLVELAQHAVSAGFALSRPSSRDCPVCTDDDGRDGAVVGPDGRLYSCWQTAGRDDQEVGDIWTGLDPTKVDARWLSCHEFDARHRGAGNASGDLLAAAFDGELLDLLHTASPCTTGPVRAH